jgi:hypothetical protein
MENGYIYGYQRLVLNIVLEWKRWKCKMLWLEKYRPRKWDDMDIHLDVKKEMENWMEEVILKKCDTYFLYLCGPAGTGKSSLARLLLEKYKLDIIEWNAVDLKQTKIFEDVLTKTLFKDNIQVLVYEKKIVTGLILEECDCLQNMGKEILSRVTENMKNKEYRTPVVCTSNELECDSIKHGKVIFVPQVDSRYILSLTQKICSAENWDLKAPIIEMIKSQSDNDIRSWIIQLESLYTFYKAKGLENDITVERLSRFLESSERKNQDLTYYHITSKLFSREADWRFIVDLYDDSVILPMMVYTNIEYRCDNLQFLKTKHRISANFMHHEIFRERNRRQQVCDDFNQYSRLLSLGSIYMVNHSRDTQIFCPKKVTFPSSIYNKKYTECTHRKMLNQLMCFFNLTRVELDYWSYFLYVFYRHIDDASKLKGLLGVFKKFFSEPLDDEKLKDVFRCDYLRPELKKRKKESIIKKLQHFLNLFDCDISEKLKKRGRPRKKLQEL